MRNIPIEIQNVINLAVRLEAGEPVFQVQGKEDDASVKQQAERLFAHKVFEAYQEISETKDKGKKQRLSLDMYIANQLTEENMNKWAKKNDSFKDYNFQIAPVQINTDRVDSLLGTVLLGSNAPAPDQKTAHHLVDEEDAGSVQSHLQSDEEIKRNKIEGRLTAVFNNEETPVEQVTQLVSHIESAQLSDSLLDNQLDQCLSEIEVLLSEGDSKAKTLQMVNALLGAQTPRQRSQTLSQQAGLRQTLQLQVSSIQVAAGIKKLTPEQAKQQVDAAIKQFQTVVEAKNTAEKESDLGVDDRWHIRFGGKTMPKTKDAEDTVRVPTHVKKLYKQLRTINGNNDQLKPQAKVKFFATLYKTQKNTSAFFTTRSDGTQNFYDQQRAQFKISMGQQQIDAKDYLLKLNKEILTRDWEISAPAGLGLNGYKFLEKIFGKNFLMVSQEREQELIKSFDDKRLPTNAFHIHNAIAKELRKANEGQEDWVGLMANVVKMLQAQHTEGQSKKSFWRDQDTQTWYNKKFIDVNGDFQLILDGNQAVGNDGSAPGFCTDT